MRPRLPFSLKAALLASCVFCPFATSASVSDGSLGNVMYVGDSITHGVNSGSYRWALHKIFADNGISYSTAGINTGNYSGGVAAGISYAAAYSTTPIPPRQAPAPMKSQGAQTAPTTDASTVPTSATGWA